MMKQVMIKLESLPGLYTAGRKQPLESVVGSFTSLYSLFHYMNNLCAEKLAANAAISGITMLHDENETKRVRELLLK